MTTDTLKLQLIERLLLTKDKGLLNKVASLFKQETDVDQEDVTDEQYSIVQERYEEYERGEGKSYTWEEVREKARKAKKE